jgi:hypothetical protein
MNDHQRPTGTVYVLVGRGWRNAELKHENLRETNGRLIVGHGRAPLNPQNSVGTSMLVPYLGRGSVDDQRLTVCV